MKRAALYARFSSERQNERSCRDQLDLCRAWAERAGMVVVAEYEDAAVSGASTVNRLGLGRMMRDARDGGFDLVLCEALDRLSRDQADLATIKKQLQFVDVGISTVADGEVGAMHIGLKGLMGELFLADLAAKTRRGLRARVTAGASGGGRSYGYQPTGTPGELRIVEAEAAIVRRVFDEYIAGATPRAIVTALNREGVSSPRGGNWNASTVNGSRERQNGILQNRLYIGELVWNRQRFIKDPATGKRVSRPNPVADWLVAAVPALAIVDPETFRAAQAIKAAKGGKNAVFARKPPHLLSGLVRCGCCGGSFTVMDRDRIGCTAVKEQGTCANHQRIGRVELEQRVLAALRERLAAPEMVVEYIRTYREERRRLAAATRSQRGERQRRAEELIRTIDRGVDQMLAGTAPAALGEKLKAMEAELALLSADLAADTDDRPVELHPGAAQKYGRMVADLQQHLDGMKRGAPADSVIAEVRKLIDRIEIRPAEGYSPRARKSKNPATITVYGALADLLTASGSSQGMIGCGDPIRSMPCISFAA